MTYCISTRFANNLCSCIFIIVDKYHLLYELKNRRLDAREYIYSESVLNWSFANENDKQNAWLTALLK